MRWFMVVVLVLVMCGIGVAKEHRIVEADSSGEHSIRWEMAKDDTITSKSYKSNETMTITCWSNDQMSGATDSVAVTLDFQMLGAHGEWYSVTTTTLTADSTMLEWKLTNSPIGSADRWRLQIRATTGNRETTHNRRVFFWPEMHYGN